MPLSAGSRLGPYVIEAALGAGGMGEVYRARDTKLGRDVALKLLPELFASDPERLARFQREAQVLASLNHPHIAQIYGLEDSTATPALVMELVVGVTVAHLINSARPRAERERGATGRGGGAPGQVGKGWRSSHRGCVEHRRPGGRSAGDGARPGHHPP
jgi:hypothetical protein